MSLQHGDKLFEFYEEDKIPPNGRYSYFGTDFGSVQGFGQYIEGYILAAQAIYTEYVSCEHYRIDKLDTLVYPLCFNYRQIVELYIKYLYFKYSNTTGEEKERYIRTVSHKLNCAWNITKPFLTPLLEKVHSSFDITLLDEFIDEIDSFDGDSFRMRYPIKKDLSSVHSSSVKLDVDGLNTSMNDLFELFWSLDSEIDKVLIDNSCSEAFIECIKKRYTGSKDNILQVMGKLADLAKKEAKRLGTADPPCKSTMDISNIDFSPTTSEEKELEDMVLSLNSCDAALLALLMQSGRSVVGGRYKLAYSKEERSKDFFKIMELSLQECCHFISFDGVYENSDMCYALLEKDNAVTARWLETAIRIMDDCLATE